MAAEFEYVNRINEILDEVYETNKENLKIAAEKFAETIMNDKIMK